MKLVEFVETTKHKMFVTEGKKIFQRSNGVTKKMKKKVTEPIL
jgi:hypothetical protein